MSSKWSAPSWRSSPRRVDGLFEEKLKVLLEKKWRYSRRNPEEKLKVFSEKIWRSTPKINVGLLLDELKMVFSEWSSQIRAEGIFEEKLNDLTEKNWRLLLYELKMIFSELKVFSENCWRSFWRKAEGLVREEPKIFSKKIEIDIFSDKSWRSTP